MSPIGYVHLAGRDWFYRLRDDGSLRVEGWKTERLGPRRFRFLRQYRNAPQAFIHTFEAPKAPDPVMPVLPKRVTARRLNQESA